MMYVAEAAALVLKPDLTAMTRSVSDVATTMSSEYSVDDVVGVVPSVV
jgi:hypothetical protein